MLKPTSRAVAVTGGIAISAVLLSFVLRGADPASLVGDPGIDADTPVDAAPAETDATPVSPTEVSPRHGASGSLAAQASDRDAFATLRRVIADGSDLDAESLAALFSAAAGAEPEAAIALLAEATATRPAANVTLAGRAVLEEIRSDPVLISAWFDSIPAFGAGWITQRVSSDLFGPDPRTVLHPDGIAALAALDPAAALERWETLLDSGSWMQAAPDRAWRAWAAHDPFAVLASIEAVADAGRQPWLREQLLNQWVRLEPAAALVHAASQVEAEYDESVQAHADRLRRLAARAANSGVSASALLVAAGQLPPELAEGVRNRAFEALAEQDPDVAAARLDEVPASGRDSVVYVLAQQFAFRDPVAALAWARTQDNVYAETAVILVAAQTDTARALELAFESSEQARDRALQTVISISVNRNPADAPVLAQQLAARLTGSAHHAQAMANFSTAWMHRAPEDALDWLVLNSASLPREVHESAATAAAAQTAGRELAIARLADLPPNARGLWAERLAATYERTDPERAALLREISELSGATTP